MSQQNGMNTHVDGMYKEWFLDYASYVILERAVPLIEDGLKPVQRRILHTMFEMEDGRYNKVANIIGSTMKFHPHGDASIGDAIVQLAQKDLLIDKQGNWGNIFTGDSSAAARYIEARLSKFALEVVFNEKITNWQPSYDGRNREPIQLPVKFPLLLALGVEGIAVGLACKILPHNFIELCEASIDHLRGKPFALFPDFITAGVADFSKYNDGVRGGKIKVRAVIEKGAKKTLIIRQIPFGTNTTSLTESILAANEKGKIKIKKVEDITAENVEIVIHLHPDSADDSDNAINALYAFTDCEVSISPNSCVIRDGRPEFMSVTNMLKAATDNTVAILKAELEFERHKLSEDWHFSSLEKIFIEKRIYRNIEECETWEAVIAAIDKGMKPYKKIFLREITQDDLVRLTEIKIKRISKFDSFKANERIKSLEDQIAEIDKNLKNIRGFSIEWYKSLIKKYGKGRERKTIITDGFETIEAKKVVINNSKLYVNRQDGFAGYGLKKDEYVTDCSDLDDVIAFNREGKVMVSRIDEKKYFGKEILHIAIFNKDDTDKVYNLVYQDGKNGAVMVKRFRMGGITRDKLYDLTKGTPDSRVLFMSMSGENDAELIQINLRPKPKMKNNIIMLNLNDVLIKGRDSMGNIVTKASITKIFATSKKEQRESDAARAELKEIKLPSELAKKPTKDQQQMNINFKDLLN